MRPSIAVFLILLVPQCVVALSRDDPEVDRLIEKYWRQHKKYSVILAYLQAVHHVSVGLTWLKKRMKVLGLHRRGQRVCYTPVGVVKAAIHVEIAGTNCNIGYRQMWRILQTKYHFVTKRSTVMMLMRLINPYGVEMRRRHRLQRRIYQNKGPNFVWHLDGYDKLKPYGFAIHACIDGYSRKIIWIKLGATNNDPKVILLYYLSSTLMCNGVPTLLRSDCGTENSILAACHMLLRHNHDDQLSGKHSFRYGSSTTNTRIESWWAQLRRSVSDYWMNIFKDMIGDGSYTPTCIMNRHCLRFVYGDLIAASLNDFKERWNSHRIRRSRLSGCPCGVPDDLYTLPHLTGTNDYRKALDIEAWSFCYMNLACKCPPLYPPEFEEAATAIMQQELHITKDSIDIDNAKRVYLHLINTFDNV